MNRSIIKRNTGSVWNTFDKMFKEFEVLFPIPIEQSLPHNYSMRSDYFVENGRIHINIDCPGLSKEEVQVSLNKQTNVLMVTAKKQYEKKTDIKFVCRERSISEMSRRYRLPENADLSTFTASMENGLLSIVCDTKSVEAVTDEGYTVIPIK